MQPFALIMIGGAFTGFLGQVLQGYKGCLAPYRDYKFYRHAAHDVGHSGADPGGIRALGLHLCSGLSAGVVIALLAWAVWKLTPPSVRHLGGHLIALEVPSADLLSSGFWGSACSNSCWPRSTRS